MITPGLTGHENHGHHLSSLPVPLKPPARSQSADQQHWLLPRHGPMQRDVLWSDLTKIRRWVCKGLQEDRGTEQLHQPNFLSKPKEKSLTNQNTLWKALVELRCSQASCSHLQLSKAAPAGSFSAAPGYCFIGSADSAVSLAAL